MIKSATIPWGPFSEKHKNYIRKALKSRMCVAEGAIRSGKTIDHCIIAMSYLETCRDKIHLASGSTIGNAKLNIGDCNGFGLEHLFRGRCRWGKYKDNDALYIMTKTGEKVVIFAGGGKADSYKRILGNSYGLWIATEINEHYDSDNSRTSFLKVAFGRQLAAIDPFVLWDLNPCNPGHDIYEHYIDKYMDSYNGYLYEHFTIADNLNISEERKADIMQQYVPDSVWYRRDILGERCIAEGLVFPMYEDALVDEVPEVFEEYSVSVDYGTMNAFAAILWGKSDKVWYAIDNYYYSGRDSGTQKTDEDYVNAILTLTEDVKLGYGQRLEVIVDPSAASFIAALNRTKKFKIRKGDNAVADGLRETATCLSKGYIKISKRLDKWIKEASGYMWDGGKKEETPKKDKDHNMDATRYFCKTKKLVKRQEEYHSILLGR